MKQIKEWSPDEDEQVESDAVSPTGLSLVLYEGDEGYHFVVALGSAKFFCRELTEAALRDYLDRQRGVEADNKALQLKAQSKSKTQRDQAEAEASGLIERQQELMVSVIEQSLVDWTLTKPFAPDAIPQLTKSARLGLAKKIINNSSIGDQSSF